MEVLKLLAKRGELVPLVKQVSSAQQNGFQLWHCMIVAIPLRVGSLPTAGEEESGAERNRKAAEEKRARRRNYKSMTLHACLAKRSLLLSALLYLHNYTPMSLLLACDVASRRLVEVRTATAMRGYLPSGNTDTSHPFVLQKMRRDEMNSSDKLRRRAIKNSYELYSHSRTESASKHKDRILPPLQIREKQAVVTSAGSKARPLEERSITCTSASLVQRRSPQIATRTQRPSLTQSSIAGQRITGNSTLLSSPSLSIRSPSVHAKGSVRSSGESDTLKRSSSYSNIAMHRANAMHEAVRARYAPVSGIYKSTINRSTISRATNNDLLPNLRRASSCFNVNIAVPRLNWTRPTVRQSARPPPALPPCTTTSLDFTCHPIRRTPRSVVRCVGTPRGNTPHPVGLAFQSPYNRHKKVSARACAGYGGLKGLPCSCSEQLTRERLLVLVADDSRSVSVYMALSISLSRILTV